MNRRPCRYGPGCRNPTCAFSHPTTPTTNTVSSSSSTSATTGFGSAQILCRYGASCKRPDCRYSHQQQAINPPAFHQAPPTSSAPSSSSSVSSIPCRFGSACSAPNCKYYHEDEEEFTAEEEEFMDKILDMIEQEQLAREGAVLENGDEEDDKNIDEIWAYINKQQPSGEGNGAGESDYALPEGAEAEFEAMMHQQSTSNKYHPQQHHNHHHHQQYPANYQQPAFYGHQHGLEENLVAGMNQLNMKGMSASSAPFVPRGSFQ